MLKQSLKSLERKLGKLSTTNNTEELPDDFPGFCSRLEITSGGSVKRFSLWDFQKELADILLNNSAWITKSRQTGMSELALALALFMAYRQRGFNILIVTKKFFDVQVMSDRLKTMIRSAGIKTETDNSTTIKIRNGGTIYLASAESDEPGRGIPSVGLFIGDECAYYNVLRILEIVRPAMSMVDDPKIWYISTPNGTEDNAFYEIGRTGNPEGFDLIDRCKTIAEGDSPPFQYFKDETNLYKVFLHWLAHPRYGANPEQFKQQLVASRMSKEAISREYDLDFTTATESAFFSPLAIDNCTIDLLAMKEGRKEDTYLYSLDPNFSGEDYCCFHVWRVVNHDHTQPTSFELVHTYRQKGESVEYNIYKCHDVIKRFPKGYGIIETNAGGIVYLEQLQRMNPGIRFLKFNTNVTSKKLVCSRLKYLIESCRIKFDAKSPIIGELLRFSTKLEAVSGNDDTVMAASIATHLFCELAYLDTYIMEDWVLDD